MRWFCREPHEEAGAEPDGSDLPMNNDEALAVFNLLESAEKALGLEQQDIAMWCYREARLILRRGKP